MRLRALVTVGIVAWLVAVPLPRVESACRRAEAWVARQRALPSTLAALNGYDLIYRRAIFRALPGETKVALWRAQLDQFAQRPDLDTNQRTFVLSLRLSPALSPVQYSEIRDMAVWDQVTREVVRLFKAPQHLAALTVLGAPESAPRAPLLRFVAKVSAVSCDCFTGGHYCPAPWSMCEQMPNLCTEQPSGCGTLGGYPCDGLCRQER